MRRSVNRVDANQAEIVRVLRQLGCHVDDVSSLGEIGYDLVVQRRGELFKVEVKNGAKPPSAQALTINEKLQQQLTGDRYVILRSIEEATAWARQR
jgi:hypothetical protein